jgi:L-aminopeptidase/D-esterase-like protein
MHLVNKIHAVVLAGGSAFGLDASSGVMKYLEEREVGFDTGDTRVPVVSSAILYDLGVGDMRVRPDSQMGYEACQNAASQPPAQGNAGAGTGATVGKIFGIHHAMESGIGHACLEAGRGVLVGAIVAVNAFGDVINPNTGEIMAGARSFQAGPTKMGIGPIFADTLKLMASQSGRTILKLASMQNTVIGVVVTNARLDTVYCNKVAQMSHNGLAKTIQPAHTMMDGDTLFCLATQDRKADVNLVGALAVEAVSQAVMNAVLFAEKVGNLESITSIRQSMS